MSADDTVRYFAFGANMATDVLRERRGIEANDAEAARLDGYALRFTVPGVPLVEPSFANIEPDPDAQCWGVVYRMSRRALEQLATVEAGTYSLLEIEVDARQSGVVAALAFCDERRRPARPPSRRYRDILVRGAREHGLPDAYVDALAAQRVAYVPVVSEAFEWLLIRPAMVLRNAGIGIEPAIVRVVDTLRELFDRR